MAAYMLKFIFYTDEMILLKGLQNVCNAREYVKVAQIDGLIADTKHLFPGLVETEQKSYRVSKGVSLPRRASIYRNFTRTWRKI